MGRPSPAYPIVFRRPEACRAKMDISCRRAGKAFVICSLVLVSCSPARFGSDGTATQAVSATPSPTTLPYWDLLPLESDPVGGWISARMEDAGISFQYPAVYQEGNCGAIFTEDKVTADYQCRLIGFDGGTIRIHVFRVWGSELDKIAREGQPPPYIKLVTPVERFSLGGIPAVRYVSMNPDSKTIEYSKEALAIYGDKLYAFSYLNLPEWPSCDAPPLSEQQVYEYLLSTLEFLE
jgi:hypothetical protein